MVVRSSHTRAAGMWCQRFAKSCVTSGRSRSVTRRKSRLLRPRHRPQSVIGHLFAALAGPTEQVRDRSTRRDLDAVWRLTTATLVDASRFSVLARRERCTVRAGSAVSSLKTVQFVRVRSPWMFQGPRAAGPLSLADQEPRRPANAAAARIWSRQSRVLLMVYPRLVIFQKKLLAERNMRWPRGSAIPRPRRTRGSSRIRVTEDDTRVYALRLSPIAATPSHRGLNWSLHRPASTSSQLEEGPVVAIDVGRPPR